MYTALYRKWRPLTFNDVISQPHITNTLRNQVKNNRTAHAYLFTGSRGTGKTTCARILAKAVNCINPHEDGSPCLECEICRNSDRAALTDIIEIDAASNNGVDDIRELREAALYTPEQCKFKVYIIDEVHMLSASAFNALLKIMEEPPSYVRFILATTEIHKVPATILSRCQRFDFRRIKAEDISDRIIYIASQENIRITKEASDLIAGIADGGMRDAVSLLDQCSAFSETVTAETVALASGTADRRFLFEIMNAVATKQPSDALKIIDNLHSMSKDMQRLCEEISLQFRNLMLIKSGISDTSILSCMGSEFDTLKSLADSFSQEMILSNLRTLQDCSARMNRCINKRTEFEICIINLCTVTVQPIAQPQVVQASPQIQPQPVRQVKKNETAPKLDNKDFENMSNWADVLDEIEKVSPSISGALSGSKAFINNKAGVILIVAENPFFMELFKKNPDNRKNLENVIEKFTGRRYILMARCTAQEEQRSVVKLVQKASDSGIVVEPENK